MREIPSLKAATSNILSSHFAVKDDPLRLKVFSRTSKDINARGGQARASGGNGDGYLPGGCLYIRGNRRGVRRLSGFVVVVVGGGGCGVALALIGLTR